MPLSGEHPPVLIEIELNVMSVFLIELYVHYD